MRTCSGDHAEKMAPAPAPAVDHELSNEDGGKFGESDESPVKELVTGQIFNVEWPSDVEVVIDSVVDWHQQDQEH